MNSPSDGNVYTFLLGDPSPPGSIQTGLATTERWVSSGFELDWVAPPVVTLPVAKSTYLPKLYYTPVYQRPDIFYGMLSNFKAPRATVPSSTQLKPKSCAPAKQTGVNFL